MTWSPLLWSLDPRLHHLHHLHRYPLPSTIIVHPSDITSSTRRSRFRRIAVPRRSCLVATCSPAGSPPRPPPSSIITVRLHRQLWPSVSSAPTPSTSALNVSNEFGLRDYHQRSTPRRSPPHRPAPSRLAAHQSPSSILVDHPTVRHSQRTLSPLLAAARPLPSPRLRLASESGSAIAAARHADTSLVARRRRHHSPSSFNRPPSSILPHGLPCCSSRRHPRRRALRRRANTLIDAAIFGRTAQLLHLRSSASPLPQFHPCRPRQPRFTRNSACLGQHLAALSHLRHRSAPSAPHSSSA